MEDTMFRGDRVATRRRLLTDSCVIGVIERRVSDKYTKSVDKHLNKPMLTVHCARPFEQCGDVAWTIENRQPPVEQFQLNWRPRPKAFPAVTC